jgi:MarR family transcriptional regulator, organic hydroperoxide resistance regulator
MAVNTNDVVNAFFATMHKVQIEAKAFTRSRLKEDGLDLTPEMIQALYILWQKEGVNQQELAKLLHKDKASMTNLIDNLTKRGLVVRNENPEDRRNKIVTLTEKGIKLRKIVQQRIDEVFAVAGKGIPRAAIKETNVILEKVFTNLSLFGK